LTTDATGFTYNQFSCNGLFDPNTSIGGHQPMGFDQITSIYNHYHVVASRIKVTCIRTGTSANALVSLYIDDDTTISATNAETMAERPGGRMISCWPAAGNIKSVYHSYNAQAMFGGEAFGNDSLQGTVSANPTEGAFYTIGFNTNTSSTVDVLVEITYKVIWSELKSLPGS